MERTEFIQKVLGMYSLWTIENTLGIATVFNYAPRHGGVWGSGFDAPLMF